MRTIDRRDWLRGLAATGIVLSLSRPAAARRRLTDPDLDAALVVDVASGKTLFARNDTVPRRPASLVKLMTLYLLFEALATKKLTLESELPVSAHAAAQPRSHLRLRRQSTITVEKAIEAIIVRSANDVAVAVAEAIGGSEPGFAVLMNAKAHAFGMVHTVYRNASGLSDDEQLTTADDIAVLARHLIGDFPQYFFFFRTKSMIWRGNEYMTHNNLIFDYPGTDGMKTGYTDESGYNIVATAERGDRRLIAIVMGGITPRRRDRLATELLDQAFSQPSAPLGSR